VTKSEFVSRCKNRLLAGEFEPTVMATNGTTEVLRTLKMPEDTPTRRRRYVSAGEAIVDCFGRKVPTLVVSVFEARVSKRCDCRPCDDPNNVSVLIFSILEFTGKEMHFSADVYEVVPGPDLVFRGSARGSEFKDLNMKALCEGMIQRLRAVAQ